MKKTGDRNEPRSERGYALVGIMVVMMFSLVLMTAAAPKLRFEAQREKEEEMLWRGQQIAVGLSNYQKVRSNFPTDLMDLVKGVEVGTKKMRFLRPSALCDPMTPCTPGESNWRPVRPGDPLVKELLDAYISTRERGQASLPPPPALLVQFAAMGASQLPGGLGLGLGSDNQSNGNNDKPADAGDGQSDDKLKGPIIGVVSRKNDRMFRNYYGIEQYDKTLFFPNVPVAVSGFNNPLLLGAASGAGGGGAIRDPNCPNGGMPFNGKCYGILNGGICPPPGKVDANGQCVAPPPPKK